MFITKFLLQRQQPSSHHTKLEVLSALLTQHTRCFAKQQVKAVPTQAADISEDFDTLLKKLSTNANSFKSESAQKHSEQERVATVIKQKDDVVYITDPRPEWGFMSPLRIGGQSGPLSIAIALQQDQAIALLLSKQDVTNGDVKISSQSSVQVKASFGAVNTALGSKIKESQLGNTYDIDLTSRLDKTTTIHRSLVKKQMYTGHMRLDLAQPLTQGNVILFKGHKNLGKTRLAVNTIHQFLSQDENNKAVYVGLYKNNAVKAFDVLPLQYQSRAAFFTVGGEDTTISNAEYHLAPKVALQTAQASSKQGGNILFVFDDVLLHHFKERHIFDLANQPFAPVNMYNEIMENTGVFDNKCSFTSVFIVDNDSTSLPFLKDERVLIQHLESIADQVVDFSSERVSMTKGMMPVIEMKPDSTTIDYWQTPYVRSVKHQLQRLINELTSSHQMHVLRKQFKMDEDPWDNYLIHDANHTWDRTNELKYAESRIRI